MPILFHRHLSLGTICYVAIIFGILLLLGFYALFQARHIIDGPLINVSGSAYSGDSATVVLEGKAENIVSLYLNDRPIYTDDAGNFKEVVVLPMGYTVVTLEARDRYGRESELERAFVRTESPITQLIDRES